MRSFLVLLVVASVLAGCSSTPRPRQAETSPSSPKSAKGGGYYLDDGPAANPPSNLEAVPDATPRDEPLHRYANRPYEVAGNSYVPVSDPLNFRQQGMASWYGTRFHGKPTSSGEPYNMYAMTAAHPTLPIPSYAKVTSVASGKSVIVRINDRGPFHSDRIIDLSYTAAYKLGFLNRGSGEVIVESVGPDTEQIRYSTEPAVAPKPETVSVPQVAAAKPGYYVQLGAFGNRENAENLLAKAREALDIPTNLLQVTLIGALHRVRLGPFQNNDDARNWVEKTRSVLGMSAIILAP